MSSSSAAATYVNDPSIIYYTCGVCNEYASSGVVWNNKGKFCLSCYKKEPDSLPTLWDPMQSYMSNYMSDIPSYQMNMWLTALNLGRATNGVAHLSTLLVTPTEQRICNIDNKLSQFLIYWLMSISHPNRKVKVVVMHGGKRGANYHHEIMCEIAEHIDFITKRNAEQLWLTCGLQIINIPCDMTCLVRISPDISIEYNGNGVTVSFYNPTL